MPEKTERQKAEKNITENRKAFHDYHILETFEAGLSLLGTEVKAIREGRVNLRDSYAQVDRGEVFARNIHISPYSHRGRGSRPDAEPQASSARQEIRKLIGKTVERGMTLVPLRMSLQERARQARPGSDTAEEGLRSPGNGQTS